MSELIRPLADMYDFSTHTLSVGIADLDEEVCGRRMRDGQGSSIAFLVGHLLACRTQVLMSLGLADENPWHEIFGKNNPAEDHVNYPSMEELAQAWKDLGKTLHDALAGLSDEQVLAPGPDFLPVEDRTNRGLLQFFAWHEAYHLGQVGLLRTEFGTASFSSRVRETL